MVLRIFTVLLLLSVAAESDSAIISAAAEQGNLLNENRKGVEKLISKHTASAVPVLIKAEERREFYKVSGSGGSELLLVIGSAKGRYDYFDYAVVVDSKYSILEIEILKYRSEYGYEITSKQWLKKFYNREGDRFVYKQNIDGLSGASWSAPSLVDEMNAVTEALKALSKRKNL